MSFVDDLKDSQEYENKVMRRLLKETWVVFERNEDKKWVDLVNAFATVEVKYDRRVGKDSDNVFLEISCSGNESWIFAYDCDWLIIWWDEDFVLIKLALLQELVIDWIVKGKYEVKKAGDGYRVRWLAVNYEELASYGKKIKL